MQGLKSLLAATGLKPLAVRAYNYGQKVYHAGHDEFRVDLDGAQAVFSTLDDHSKRFFHFRYNRGEMHEPPVSQELIARLDGAKVFADVGAHLGYYACIAGSVFPDLKLYLFEMNHNLMELIERNLAANKLHDAMVTNKPVSDRKQTISYEDNSLDAGLTMSQDAQSSGKTGGGLVHTESVTLDDFFADKDAAPDVIKIDVQGAEMQVLRGARKIIENNSPILFLEVHPHLLGSFGTSLQEIHAFLQDNGYDRVRLINEHREKGGSLVTLDEAEAAKDRTHMLLCENSALDATASGRSTVNRTGQDTKTDLRVIEGVEEHLSPRQGQYGNRASHVRS